MYESAQHLEARGDRVAAAELLARALAEEAQRINQAEQSALDLSVDGHADLSVDLSKRATNQLRPLGAEATLSGLSFRCVPASHDTSVALSLLPLHLSSTVRAQPDKLSSAS